MPKITANLQGRKLFLATPMYGGQCAGLFAKSMADLSALCVHHKIGLQLYYLFNESLITRARNYCADSFMNSNAEHLMWVDSDIGFDPRDVLALMALQVQKPEYDIIGGPYAKKTISWEKVVQAVNKGLAEPPQGEPNDLERYIGDFVFNPKQGTASIRVDEPCEVLEVGTGFMMVRRETMEKFKEAYWETCKYKPDHVRTAQFDGSREIMQFFQAEIINGRYLSEDYWFTQKAQAIGLRTWLCPWMRLNHMGTYIYGGSLIDLAKSGSAATADMSELNKYKKK